MVVLCLFVGKSMYEKLWQQRRAKEEQILTTTKIYLKGCIVIKSQRIHHYFFLFSRWFDAHRSLYITALNVHLCALTSSIRNKLHAASINPWYDFPFCIVIFVLYDGKITKRVEAENQVCLSPRITCREFSLSLDSLAEWVQRCAQQRVYFAIELEHLTFNFLNAFDRTHQLKYARIMWNETRN